MKRSKWLLLCLALVSAILTFRIAAFVVSIAFLIIQRFPFRVIAFVHAWDSVLVPVVSLSAAVAVSRWQERVLETKGLKTNYLILTVVALLAFCPLQPQAYDVRPVMCSPLHIAIEDNYPIETLELLIDRYPGLINGRDVEWDNYCPLVSAAYSGKTNVVQLLISKGANVDYAVERLQQINAEQPIALILKCSQDYNKVPNDTARKLADPQH